MKFNIGFSVATAVCDTALSMVSSGVLSKGGGKRSGASNSTGSNATISGRKFKMGGSMLKMLPTFSSDKAMQIASVAQGSVCPMLNTLGSVLSDSICEKGPQVEVST